MKAQASFLARVPDGQGHFPFVKVPLKKGQPLPVPGASSYYLRYRENGQRRTVALGNDLQTAFLGYANRQLSIQQKELGIPVTAVLPAPRRAISAAHVQFIDEIDKLGKARKTVKSYGTAIRNFRVGCTKTYLEEIDRADFIAYINWLRSHLGKHRINGSLGGERNSTIANQLRYLRAFLRRFDVKMPLPERDWPKATRKNPDRYSEEEINQLLAAADEDGKDLITFLFYTGFRDEEVAHAYYKDINWKRGTINVHDKPEFCFKVKDHEQRPIDIPLPDKFIQRLKARRERYPKSELIFSNEEGRPEKHLLDRIKEIARKAQLESNATLHKFRRTFGTLYAQRFGVRQAQAALGHSKLETTARYLAADDMSGAETKSAVNQLFASVGD